MSKHKEKKPAPLADWEVSLSNAEGVASGWHRIPASRWKRTGKKGCCFYTFTDERGVVAEFPPGVVLSIKRADPLPALAERLASAEDPDRQSGYELAGPEIKPVGTRSRP